MKKTIEWFARGGGIAKAGPFKTQVEAVDAMRLVPEARRSPSDEFPADIFVWPEVRKSKTTKKSKRSN